MSDFHAVHWTILVIAFLSLIWLSFEKPDIFYCVCAGLARISQTAV